VRVEQVKRRGTCPWELLAFEFTQEAAAARTVVSFAVFMCSRQSQSRTAQYQRLDGRCVMQIACVSVRPLHVRNAPLRRHCILYCAPHSRPSWPQLDTDAIDQHQPPHTASADTSVD